MPLCLRCQEPTKNNRRYCSQSCVQKSGLRLIDITGKKFGYLTVLNKVSSNRVGRIYWQCKCECGTIKRILGGHLKSGKIISCGCKQFKTGNQHKQWGGTGDISGNYWDSLKRGASGKKGNRSPVELSITIEDAWQQFLKQNRRCALTGLPLVFNFGRKTGPEHTASLDRIDSAKGYIPGNIQWVHKTINFMKRTYDQQYFIEMCQLVALHNS